MEGRSRGIRLAQVNRCRELVLRIELDALEGAVLEEELPVLVLKLVFCASGKDDTFLPLLIVPPEGIEEGFALLGHMAYIDLFLSRDADLVDSLGRVLYLGLVGACRPLEEVGRLGVFSCPCRDRLDLGAEGPFFRVSALLPDLIKKANHFLPIFLLIKCTSVLRGPLIIDVKWSNVRLRTFLVFLCQSLS